MKKILLALLTCLLACLCIVGLTACGDTPNTPTGEKEYSSTEGLEYTLSEDETYYICTGIGTAKGGSIVIGSTYNELPVKEISEDAFAFNNTITKVTIPESIEKIGKNAFNECNNLNYNYKNGGYYLGNNENAYYAFMGVGDTTLRSFTMQDTTKVIKDNSLQNLTELTTLSLSKSLKKLDVLTLEGCLVLETLTVPVFDKHIGALFSELYKTYYPENIELSSNEYLAEFSWDEYYKMPKIQNLIIASGCTTIYADFCRGCKSIQSVTIPESTTSIGNRAFYNCSSLTSITVNENNTNYSSQDGVVYNKDKTEFIYVPEGKTSITIPNTITSVNDVVFYNCNKLRYNEYGNGLYLGSIENPYMILVKPENRSITNCSINVNCKFIYYHAFYNCSSLTSITIPDSVTSIGDSAFYNCSNLTSITIPDSVTSIGDNAFRYCSSLETVTIGKGVKKVDASFVDCSNLKKVNYLGTAYDWTQIDVFYSPLVNGADLYISGELLTEIHIDWDVKYDSFEGCTSLRKVTIGNNVKDIVNCSFSNCENLQFNEYDNGLYLGSENNPYLLFVKLKDTNVSTCEINSNTKFIVRSAFSEKSLTSLTIPASVTSIGDYAFEYCDSLTSITVEENNQYYSSQDGILYNKEKTEFLHIPKKLSGSVTIPEGITGIDEYAFYKVPITDIVIPASVTSIGSYAFYDCSSLTSITVEENNQYYSSQDGIMYNKEKTEFLHIPEKLSGSVTIPNSITNINGDTFNDYAKITSIIVEESNQNYASQDGILYNKQKTEFVCVPRRLSGSVTIPEGVTSIDYEAFSYCGSLTSITVDENNQYYSSQDGILYNKAKTEFIHIPARITGSVTIPNTITSIGDYAFEYCSKLTSITIPDSVTSIGSGAFRNCTSLTSITIPDSVTSIGYYAFYDCSSLTNVYIEDIVAWCKIDFEYNLAFNDISSNPLYYAENLYLNNELVTDLIIPDTVTEIKKCVFYNYDKLTRVEIPDGVTSIGYYAFRNCTSLTSITIPNSVTSIGEAAFFGCSSLKQKENGISYVDKWAIDCDTSVVQATLRENTVGIAEDAFRNCTSLTTITIPDSVTSIGYAFFGCSSLEKVYISDIEAWCNIDFNDDACNPLSKGASLYLNNEIVTELVIPETIKEIKNYAFYNCSSLTSITIPEGVTSIGKGAFYDCNSLTSLTIPDSVTSIGYNALYRCYSLQCNQYNNALYLGNNENPYVILIEAEDEDIMSCEINRNCKIVYDSAFYDCDQLTTITFGANSQLLSIGYRAFYNCRDLESITIPEGVTSIGSGAFYWCSSLASITIPNSVTSIGDYAFEYCSKLTSITIPEGVTSIGDYAFYDCSSLTSITIPDSVTSIGYRAFRYCDRLTSVTIPDSVTSIGSYAFEDCYRLTSINFNGTKAQWNAISKGSYWNSGTGNYTIYCTDGEIAK